MRSIAAPGMASDPEDCEQMRRYLESAACAELFGATIESARCYLHVFLAGARRGSLMRPQEVTSPILERYQRYLFHWRAERPAARGFSTQLNCTDAVRGVFQMADRPNVLL